jgi:hypothetical protein
MPVATLGFLVHRDTDWLQTVTLSDQVMAPAARSLRAR